MSRGCSVSLTDSDRTAGSAQKTHRWVSQNGIKVKQDIYGAHTIKMLLCCHSFLVPILSGLFQRHFMVGSINPFHVGTLFSLYTIPALEKSNNL